MDLEWVATFLDAADTESFREVARRRLMSQAAVSQQMAVPWGSCCFTGTAARLS
jgi:DNA-binding transcriptional LysR family regulator